jgi:hypothetical protein
MIMGRESLTRLWRFGSALILLIALVGLAVLLVRLTAAEEDEGGGYLFSDLRTRLSICVDTRVDDVAVENPVDRVRKALADAFSRARAEGVAVPREYNDPVVVAGCPPSVALGEVPLEGGVEQAARSKVVSSLEDLSPHLIHLYFVGEDALQAAFHDRDRFFDGAVRPYAFSTEEMFCPTDACWDRTTGLYVVHSADAGALVRALHWTLGLRLPPTPGPEPTLDFRSCVPDAEGTPAPWCDIYDICTSGTPNAHCEHFRDSLPSSWDHEEIAPLRISLGGQKQ